MTNIKICASDPTVIRGLINRIRINLFKLIGTPSIYIYFSDFRKNLICLIHTKKELKGEINRFTFK